MIMHAFIILLTLSGIRAHIPNSYSFGSGPAEPTFGRAIIRGLAAVLMTIGCTAALVWLAVRLVMAFL
jgi:preprotein translocase subunit SecG